MIFLKCLRKDGRGQNFIIMGKSFKYKVESKCKEEIKMNISNMILITYNYINIQLNYINIQLYCHYYSCSIQNALRDCYMPSIILSSLHILSQYSHKSHVVKRSSPKVTRGRSDRQSRVTSTVSLLCKVCKCETGLKYKPSVPRSPSESFLHEGLFTDVISEKWSLIMVSNGSRNLSV